MYPVIFSLGPLSLYTFGIFAFLAFFFASFIVWKLASEARLNEEEVFDAVITVTVAGILFARALFVVLNFDSFGLSIFKWFSLVRQPGLSFPGGLVGGGLALWLVSRFRRWDFFTVADISVTGLSLAQAIGWIGAFFSGFGFGREVKRFGLLFPGFDTPHFPLQLVRVLLFLSLFIILWSVEKLYRTFEWYRNKKATAETGFLAFSYFVGLGLIQLIVAFFREARVYFSWIPVDIVLALVILLIGVIGLYWRSGREVREDLFSLRYKFLKNRRRIKNYEKNSVSSKGPATD